MKRTLTLFFIIIFFTVLMYRPAFALQKLKELSDGLPKGVKVYKYRSDDKRAVLYVAEMDRRYYPSIKFRTSVARGRVLGRATVQDIVRQATRNGRWGTGALGHWGKSSNSPTLQCSNAHWRYH